MSGGLADRVALVTGAGRGIGRAVVTRLVAEGVAVVATDVDGDGLAVTSSLVERYGAKLTTSVVDLADRAARSDLVPFALRTYGRLDILVNNAAYHGRRVGALEFDDDDWDRVIEVNLSAPAAIARAAGQVMVDQGGGAMVNLGAIQSDLPLPTYLPYAASKGGVAALTRALAAELSPYGVRVNAVIPGTIDTESFRDTLAPGTTDPESGGPGRADPPRQADLPRVASLLPRPGTASEVASAVAFLAGDDASYVTGALLHVDGGRSLSRLPDPTDARYRGYRLEGG